MKKQDHLPIYGVGPLFGMSVTAVTLLGIAAHHLGWLDSGRVPGLKLPLLVLGILLILGAVWLWCTAVLVNKIDRDITQNRLRTDGAYGWVRNPIYSAIVMACTGACLCVGNLWLLILPPVFYIYLTLLMKATEEKWLLELYGDAYREYCKQVNRCIPRPPKK